MIRYGLKELQDQNQPLAVAADLKREIRSALILVGGMCCQYDPSLWATKCGWRWVRSGSLCKTVFVHELDLNPIAQYECMAKM